MHKFEVGTKVRVTAKGAEGWLSTSGAVEGTTGTVVEPPYPASTFYVAYVKLGGVARPVYDVLTNEGWGAKAGEVEVVTVASEANKGTKPSYKVGDRVKVVRHYMSDAPATGTLYSNEEYDGRLCVRYDAKYGGWDFINDSTEVIEVITRRRSL